MGDGLIERLARTICEGLEGDPDAHVFINPDGPEAASRIAQLEAKLAQHEADAEIYQQQADHEFKLRKAAEAKLATAVGLLGELFEEGPVEVLFAGNPIPAMDLERRSKSFLASIQERT